MRFYRLNLQELAAAAGVALAGATGAEPPPNLHERLQRRLAEGRATPFEERDPARRLAPERLLPGCRTIVVIGLPYHVPDPDYPVAAPGPRGEVARCARGADYHLLLQEKAGRLASLIKKALPVPVQYRIFADRSPLVERELARRAGLGRIGENCTLITTRYGSYVALGTILLDRALEPDEPAEDSCLSCGRCREACPTGALAAPFILDPRRCLSYLTQASGVIPATARPLLGTRLYGCDRCQEVCPLNEAAAASPHREVAFSFFPARPLLLPLLQMTQKEFAQTIGLTSAGWRGKTTLQRNAAVALGNSGDEAAIPALGRLLKNDCRILLRLHAAWALGRIGGEQARRFLEAARRSEPEPAVRTEIETALA